MPDATVHTWEAFQASFGAEFGLDLALIRRDARLVEELGFDSLSMIHLEILVEELTGELVDYTKLPEIATVGDAYDYYLQMVADRVVDTP